MFAPCSECVRSGAEHSRGMHVTLLHSFTLETATKTVAPDSYFNTDCGKPWSLWFKQWRSEIMHSGPRFSLDTVHVCPGRAASTPPAMYMNRAGTTFSSGQDTLRLCSHLSDQLDFGVKCAPALWPGPWCENLLHHSHISYCLVVDKIFYLYLSKYVLIRHYHCLAFT